ncbi:hypothetical protein NSI01_27250 [Pimelobacter simplex]|nr:hypothetical protein NSI01_27250 [Pimelobacter simplex]
MVEQVVQVGVGRVVADDLEEGQDGELGHGRFLGVWEWSVLDRVGINSSDNTRAGHGE